MKYAKIKNGKIANVINGLAPSDYVPVTKIWETPTDYPVVFYTTNSNKPMVSIVNGKPQEHWTFGLKSVDMVKEVIYDKQKKIRQKMQLGSFDFAGTTVTLKDREDSLIISTLPELETRYKVAQGTWITLTGVQVAALKEAHRVHVQAAYDWEEAQNTLVSAMTTHEQLKDYYNQM